ncbi:hypothetical protein SK128_025841 [Halocaridina rubra]|uniref:Ribonucleases P/MRP subunit Pop8-like domain-containing protein n=1 Tax=Halocaridina rubra TaxID=373956 RepID=A0AAN8WIH4_HALRR
MKELECRNWYMRVVMEYDQKILPCSMTASLVKFFMKSAITTLFGEISSAFPLDILKFDEESKEVIIRVPKDNYAKVRAALTLCSATMLEGAIIPIIYTVEQASSCLISLDGPQKQLA